MYETVRVAFFNDHIFNLNFPIPIHRLKLKLKCWLLSFKLPRNHSVTKTD